MPDIVFTGIAGPPIVLTIGNFSRMRYSIVIPLYNKAPHIERALRSVFAQSVGDWELIVIDDASTDGGEAIVARLIAGDPRVRLLRREVPGAGGYAARNLGVSEARSEWIAFLDADDEWAPRLLEEYDRLRALFPSSGFVGTAKEEVTVIGARRLDPYVSINEGSTPRLFDLLYYAEVSSAGRNPIQTSAVAVRRDLLLAVGGFPSGGFTRGGDRDTWLRLFAKTNFAWSPYLGAVYYRNAVNMVTKATEPEITTAMDRTFDALLADRDLVVRYSKRLRLALQRLSNYERRGAFRLRMREGTLALQDARTLYFWANPAYVAGVVLLSLLPRKAIGAVMRLRTKLKSATSRDDR